MRPVRPLVCALPLTRTYFLVPGLRYRDFKSDTGATEQTRGFIDGDLIESFLSLSPSSSLVEQILEVRPGSFVSSKLIRSFTDPASPPDSQGGNAYEKIELSHATLCSLIEELKRLH